MVRARDRVQVQYPSPGWPPLPARGEYGRTVLEIVRERLQVELDPAGLSPGAPGQRYNCDGGYVSGIPHDRGFSLSF